MLGLTNLLIPRPVYLNLSFQDMMTCPCERADLSKLIVEYVDVVDKRIGVAGM